MPLFRKWSRRLPSFLNPLGADHRDQAAGAMDHSQVSAALLSFPSFMVVTFMTQVHHHIASHSARNGPVVADLFPGLQFPVEEAKPGSTQIL